MAEHDRAAEKRNLSTHVELCALRYKSVEATLKRQNWWIYAIAALEALRLFGVDGAGMIKILLKAG